MTGKGAGRARFQGVADDLGCFAVVAVSGGLGPGRDGAAGSLACGCGSVGHDGMGGECRAVLGVAFRRDGMLWLRHSWG